MSADDLHGVPIDFGLADDLYGDPVISILLPVLARPDNAARVVDSIRSSSTVDVEIVFLCSPDDLDERHACEETGERVIVVTWSPGHGDYSAKIQAGFNATRGEWILTGADDLVFHQGWDLEALRTAAGSGARVVGSNDLHNPQVLRGRHSTHSLIRRDYILSFGATFDDGPGVVLHPHYRHNFCDTELVHAAIARGEWAFSAHSHIEHIHPYFDKTVPRDSTYDRALDSEGIRADARLFQTRKRAFDQARRTRR